MQVTDATLVLGVRNGDRSAFAELYDRRARLIRAICLDETRDLDAAADLTQEVFLRAYRRLGDLRDAQRFGAWLAGIARQVCREWRRGARRAARRTAGYAIYRLRTAELERAESEPSQGTDGDLSRLREVLAGPEGGSPRPVLNELERHALHAYYLQGRSVEEARSVLGLSRSSFYRVLSSACRRIRAALSGQEVRR